MRRSISMFFMVCIFLLGCSNFQENNIQRKECAEKIITVMLTAPNDKLYNINVITIIGEGVESTQENTDKQTELIANWQNTVGDCFASDVLEESVRSGILTQYLGEAFITEETLSLKNFELKQAGEYTELYTVYWSLGNENRCDDIFFRFNEDNLIEEIKILSSVPAA